MKKDAFEDKLKSAVPPWAMATCAVLFCFALTVRIIGIDISTPINRIFTAYAISIELQAKGAIDYEDRIKRLESMAHKAGK